MLLDRTDRGQWEASKTETCLEIKSVRGAGTVTQRLTHAAARNLRDYLVAEYGDCSSRESGGKDHP